MENNTSQDFINESLQTFQGQKSLADKTLDQLNLEEWSWKPGTESNSIAIIMHHMYGNMFSRWTDFLTTDGEKPSRNRDEEFEEQSLTPNELRKRWDDGWNLLFETIKGLTPDDLNKTIYIRTEPHSVTKAILRQISHYGYHVGQIVFLGKQIKDKQWQTLSIARRQSKDFNKLKGL